MTAAILTAITDPWFDILAAIFLGALSYCLVAELRAKSHEIDAVIAEETRRSEHERQQQRAQIAKRRTELARLRMLGHHGGAEFQQAEYAEACGWVPARAWDTAADLTALDEVETPADMFGEAGR